MLNAGVPVRVLLEPIILQAVNEGKVNIDLALLSLRPLVYMIAGFGYHAGINVVLDYPRKDNGLDPRPLEKAFKQIREQSEAPKVIDMERTLVPEEAPKVIDMKRTLVPKKEIT
jgi:hypothetical protein